MGDLPDLLWEDEIDAVASISAVSADIETQQLTVTLDVRGFNDVAEQRTIECEKAVRWVLTSATIQRFSVEGDHPALLEFADERAELFFASAPPDPARTADALRGAHARAVEPYLSFEAIANTEAGGVATLLSGGYGQLAQGPLSLLTEFEAILARDGVKTSLLACGPPLHFDEHQNAWLPPPAGLNVLDLGESWVVAQRYTVRAA